MARPLIGRTIRRLRQDQKLTQQALAARLGISASYLNLIEHDQRGVTASLLIKLGHSLQVDLAALSGSEERQTENHLREVFRDPALGMDPVAEEEVQALAGSAPNAARAVLAGVAAGHEKVLPDPAPWTGVTGLLDSAVQITLHAWVKSEDWWQTQADLMQAGKEALDEAGIEIPFPHQVAVPYKNDQTAIALGAASAAGED